MFELMNISASAHLIYSLFYQWVLEHGPSIVFVLLAALCISWVSKHLVERVIRHLVPANKYGGSKQAEIKRENTLIRIANGTISVILWLVVVLTILSELGIDIGPLLAAAGVAGLAFGFGGQYLIKDLISGFFIIFENQYRIGDVVCFGKTCGLVEDITLRATILRDLDGVVHHVPHGTIERVSNLSKQFARVNLDLRIPYSADLEKVIRILNKVGAELAADVAWKDDVLKPIQFERVDSFGESAIIVKVLGDTLPLRQWAVAGEYRLRVKVAFDKAKIQMPFPQHTLHMEK